MFNYIFAIVDFILLVFGVFVKDRKTSVFIILFLFEFVN